MASARQKRKIMSAIGSVANARESVINHRKWRKWRMASVSKAKKSVMAAGRRLSGGSLSKKLKNMAARKTPSAESEKRSGK
jgi:hypothetical protein